MAATRMRLLHWSFAPQAMVGTPAPLRPGSPRLRTRLNRTTTEYHPKPRRGLSRAQGPDSSGQANPTVIAWQFPACRPG